MSVNEEDKEKNVDKEDDFRRNRWSRRSRIWVWIKGLRRIWVKEINVDEEKEYEKIYLRSEWEKL